MMPTALQVEWYSALEGAVARIVKLVAGVDEPDEREGRSSSKAKGWAEQLEQTYAAVGEHTLELQDKRLRRMPAGCG